MKNKIQIIKRIKLMKKMKSIQIFTRIQETNQSLMKILLLKNTKKNNETRKIQILFKFSRQYRFSLKFMKRYCRHYGKRI
jgi:hypothetical protein